MYNELKHSKYKTYTDLGEMVKTASKKLNFKNYKTRGKIKKDYVENCLDGVEVMLKGKQSYMFRKY